MGRIFAAAALALVVSQACAQAPDVKWSMDLGVEGRAFLQSPAYAGQESSGVSLFAQPEVDVAVPRGNLRFVGFGRWDQHDSRRTHADIRELTLRQRIGNFDFVAGIARVFWGVTESVHLVDIINQTDLVENPDGETKLGQPLVSLSWATDYGDFTGYLLPYFRERTLPGDPGRFRAPIPYDHGDPVYESRREEKRLDVALRWSLVHGPVDLGVSHFSGTAREPRFIAGTVNAEPVLKPVYDLIEQTAVDLSWVGGGWLWKLESLYQHNRERDFTAAAGGFEYTFYSVRNSSWDIGSLLEVLLDSRGSSSPSPFQRDVFLGTRLAANDIAGTEVLAGVVVDLDRYGLFGNVEASRRVGANSTIALEIRLFDAPDTASPLHLFRKDDYVELKYSWFF